MLPECKRDSLTNASGVSDALGLRLYRRNQFAVRIRAR